MLHELLKATLSPSAHPPENSANSFRLATKSFPCHTSEKRRPKSNHCHRSKNSLPQVLCLPHLRPASCAPSFEGSRAKSGMRLRLPLPPYHLRRGGMNLLPQDVSKPHLSLRPSFPASSEARAGSVQFCFGVGGDRAKPRGHRPSAPFALFNLQADESSTLVSTPVRS